MPSATQSAEILANKLFLKASNKLTEMEATSSKKNLLRWGYGDFHNRFMFSHCCFVFLWGTFYGFQKYFFLKLYFWQGKADFCGPRGQNGGTRVLKTVFTISYAGTVKLFQDLLCHGEVIQNVPMAIFWGRQLCPEYKINHASQLMNSPSPFFSESIQIDIT